jgi:hypothetical protein
LQAYFLDENDISKPGNSPLLEVPMSIQFKHSALMNSIKQGYDKLRGKLRFAFCPLATPDGRQC